MVAAKKHKGQLPAWLEGLDLQIIDDEDDLLKLSFSADSFLRACSSFFDKEQVRIWMQTDEGKAEMTKWSIHGLAEFGWTLDCLSGPFVASIDNAERNLAYVETVQQNSRVILFNQDFTWEYINNPRLLTLAHEDGGLPHSHIDGISNRNENYRNSMTPGYYVATSKRGVMSKRKGKLSQTKTYTAIGVGVKTEPSRRELRALKSQWVGRRRVSDKINGRWVAFGY